MKKWLVRTSLLIIVILSCNATYAQDKHIKSGKVNKLNKEMFLKHVFNYEKNKEWKYEGAQPAIIDLYANWCAPCLAMKPVISSLAKKYKNQITFYKINVDREKELAAFFNATSIPLFVFIPTKGDPRLLTGSTSKKNIEQIINNFLLKGNKL